MSARQKQPGTTRPDLRIAKAIDKRLNKPLKKDRDPNKKPKSGSKADRIRTKDPEEVGSLHRKPGTKKKIKTDKEIKKGVDMNDIVSAVRYIIENHGQDIREVMSGFGDRDLLSKMAKKCMSTCLGGWKNSGEGLVSENTDLILSGDSWEIMEDGTTQLKSGFKFDYDWLYDLSNASLITEDIVESELDKDEFADTLSNASNLLRKLADKEVKKYILNAAKEDEDVDLMNLKEVLEDTGVNWKFIGAEIETEKINLLIRVRYSKDGTQDGVIEKKLSIEVKPSADVTDATEKSIPDEREEVDLAFPGGEIESEKPEIEEPATEPEIPEEPEIAEPQIKSDIPEEPEAGLDLEVNL